MLDFGLFREGPVPVILLFFVLQSPPTPAQILAQSVELQRKVVQQQVLKQSRDLQLKAAQRDKNAQRLQRQLDDLNRQNERNMTPPGKSAFPPPDKSQS